MARKKQAQPVREGTLLGGCRIMHEIGHGGNGTVYLAHHLRLDIPVAIKVLTLRSSNANYNEIERFMMEARVAAKIRHPNVVQVLDVDQADDMRYIIFEYMDGGSVQSLLNTGPLDEKQAVAILTEVARALIRAEELGVVHRDIKPSNILLNKVGDVKLSDLGLAKDVLGQEANKLTSADVWVGTPYYMAPEQAEDARSVDSRADIYSLGATFYHMVTGRVPFDGKGPLQVLMKHLNAALISPIAVNPAVTPGCSKLITWMMARNPDHRLQSASELFGELEKLQGLSPAVPEQQARTKQLRLFVACGNTALPLVGHDIDLGLKVAFNKMVPSTYVVYAPNELAEGETRIHFLAPKQYRVLRLSLEGTKYPARLVPPDVVAEVLKKKYSVAKSLMKLGHRYRVLENDIVLLELVGDIDLETAPDLDNVLNHIMQSGHRRILIDGSQLEFVSSSGIGAFTRRINECTIVFANFSGKPKMVFEVTGLTRLIPMFDTVEEALEKFDAAGQALQSTRENP